MLVGIGERIRLLNILPEKGNILTIKMVRQLREALSLSEEEHRDNNVVIQEDRVSWNLDFPDKEIEFNDLARELIAKVLKELNEKDELTVGDVRLWEEFVEEE
jgi:uncharacterized protein YjaG (DUF416 family)